MSNVKFEYIGLSEKQFNFRVTIGKHEFKYFMGLGHARNEKAVKNYGVEPLPKQPTENDFLECIFSDAEAGEMLFKDFCDNFGYSDDSIKALEIYRECQNSAMKVRELERAGLIKRPEQL